MHQVELNSGTSKSSKKLFYMSEDVDLQEPLQNYIENRVKLSEEIELSSSSLSTSISIIFNF